VQGRVDSGDFPAVEPHELQVQRAISAPLIHRDELLGVLNVRTMLEGA
jgi:hypothetical protein